MPLYTYECECGEVFDEFNSIEKRHTKKCEKCGAKAKQRITPVRIDYYNMGTDPYGNPTAAAKWARMHEKEALREYDPSPIVRKLNDNG